MNQSVTCCEWEVQRLAKSIFSAENIATVQFCKSYIGSVALRYRESHSLNGWTWSLSVHWPVGSTVRLLLCRFNDPAFIEKRIHTRSYASMELQLQTPSSFVSRNNRLWTFPKPFGCKNCPNLHFV